MIDHTRLELSFLLFDDEKDETFHQIEINGWTFVQGGRRGKAL